MALDRKIAYINLSTGEIRKGDIPLEWRKKFIGGRGLDAYLLYTNNPPGIDAFDPENRVLISAGIVVGTLA
ncbi:MAG: aldehyde ferredoxin oxidoreductase N-terminal domain-containing protein, partial [Desulfatiglandales bacterium]